MSAKTAGRQILVDLWGCPEGLLRDVERLDLALRSAAKAANVDVVDSIWRMFPEGSGVTGLLLVAEGHLSIHTWPEYGYAAVDVYACGFGGDPGPAIAILERGLEPINFSVASVVRGIQTRRTWIDPSIKVLEVYSA